MNSLRRGFGALSAAALGAAALQYVLLLFTARQLGPEAYGRLAVAWTLALLAAPWVDIGMNVALVWSHSRTPERLARTLGSSLWIRLGLLLPVGGAALLVGAGFGLLPDVAWLFVPLFLAAVADGISGLFAAVFQARQRMGSAAAIQLARALARCLAFAVVLLGSSDLGLLAWGACLGSVAVAVVAARVSGVRPDFTAGRAAVGDTLRTALPFGAAIAANLLLLQTDVLLLAALAGAADAGAYHAAFRVVVLAEMLPQVLSALLVPRAYRLGTEPSPEALGRLYRTQALLLGGLATLGALALATHGGTLGSAVLGARFGAGAAILPLLAPLLLLRYLAGPLGDALTSLGHQRTLASAVWAALAVAVAANALLIPALGVPGAAAAACLAQLFLVAVLATRASRCGLDLGWRRILGPALLAALAGAVAGQLHPAATLPVAAAALALHAFASPLAEHRSLAHHAGLGFSLAPVGCRRGAPDMSPAAGPARGAAAPQLLHQQARSLQRNANEPDDSSTHVANLGDTQLASDRLHR